jgi:Ragulator complex protein LAMTOR5
MTCYIFHCVLLRVRITMSSGGSQPSVFAANGDTRDGTGIIANDRMGFCIGSEGSVLDETKSGVFTSMLRLASLLRPNGGEERETSAATTTSPPSPLIVIETDQATVLVKAYDGNTVAMKVPTTPMNTTAAAPVSANKVVNGTTQNPEK